MVSPNFLRAIASALILLPLSSSSPILGLDRLIPSLKPPTGTTNLCSGDQINITLLNSFTPSNPPSAEILKSCGPIFTKSINRAKESLNNLNLTPRTPQSKPPGPHRYSYKCESFHEARSTDVLVAALHVLQSPNRTLVSKPRSPAIVYKWGNARIKFQSEFQASRGSHLCADQALWIREQCKLGGVTAGWVVNVGPAPKGGNEGVYVDSLVGRND